MSEEKEKNGLFEELKNKMENDTDTDFFEELKKLSIQKIQLSPEEEEKKKKEKEKEKKYIEYVNAVKTMIDENNCITTLSKNHLELLQTHINNFVNNNEYKSETMFLYYFFRDVIGVKRDKLDNFDEENLTFSFFDLKDLS